VNNHQGDVRVWSQLGKGSTFTIRLREAPADVVTHHLSQTGPTSERKPKKLPRPAEYVATEEIPMLRVDDDETSLRGSA
jgi:hypothetical protein